ncbi:Uncharacterised protein [Mycobacteroides abscessus]|nr:Uncharacterised protein [Mycobacteroides abscessus]SKH68718.1 Uncharacterised protein [Mycobacteroides abscessus subsp. bolletii]
MGAPPDSVQRWPLPGRTRGRAAVQPGTRGRTVGHRRGVRGAVPAVFGDRSVRRCTAGPLGPARRPDLRQSATRPAGGPGGLRAGVQRRRCGAAAGRADSQRRHSLRDVGTVGGPAPRGTARSGRDHELGSHRRGRHRHLHRCQLHADAARRFRSRGLGFCHSYFPGDRADYGGGLGGIRLPRRPLGARRQRARRTWFGVLRGGHRMAARGAHHRRHTIGFRRAHRPGRAPHGVRCQHAAGPRPGTQ